MALSRLVALGLVTAPAFFDPETGETLIDGDNMEPISDNGASYGGEDDSEYGEEGDPEYGDRGDRLRRRKDRNDDRADNRHDRVDRRHDRRDDRLDRKLDRLGDDDDAPSGPPSTKGGWEYKPLNATEAATSTAAQKVTLRVEDAAFEIENLTLDGTTAGVRVNSITVGPDTVFQAGGALGLPASTFTGDKFAALKNLKGKRLVAGQSITVQFTPDASGDDLSVVAYGRAWRPLARC